MDTRKTRKGRFLVVVDTETTGLELERHRVIEVGASLFDVETRTFHQAFSTVVHAPENPAEAINGIPQRLLDLEVSKRPSLAPLSEMFELATWAIAHNASFDKPMLDRLCQEYGLALAERPWICSSKQLRFPRQGRSRRLGHLAVDHDIPVVGAHRALADVLTLCRLLSTIPDLEAQIEDILKPRRLFAACVTYQTRELAKQHGFTFCGDTRRWQRRLTAAEADALPFEVSLAE